MPVRFSTLVDCPRCGDRMTAETGTLRWVRNHAFLRKITRSDTDQWFIKYNFERTVYLMMDIEIKEHGAALNAEDALLWSMRDDILKGIRPDVRGIRGGKTCCHFGCHVWRLSGADPVISEWMTWDGRAIEVDLLVSILRFARHPDYPHEPMLHYLERNRLATDFEFFEIAK
jgi:hypothetical protein